MKHFLRKQITDASATNANVNTNVNTDANVNPNSSNRGGNHHENASTASGNNNYSSSNLQTHRHRYYFVLIALLVVLADQITKFIARQHLLSHPSITVIENFWQWELAYNRGVAFGMFNDSGAIWPKFFFGGIAFIVSIVLLYYILYKSYSRLSGISVAFILGGALGNLLDRILFGQVTDFILWYYKSYHWPNFNLADSFICIGVVLLIFEHLFSATHKTHML